MDGSAKTIDDLPLEVMHEVCKYLDRKSLKSATLVSRAWNSKFSSSNTFLTKFRLVIALEEKNNAKGFNFKFERNYRNVFMKDFRMDRTFIDRFNFKRVWGKLTLARISITKDDFVYLMQKCQQRLEEFEVFSIKFVSKIIRKGKKNQPRSINELKTVNLPKLRKFIVSNSTWILNYIECVQVDLIQIEEHCVGNQNQRMDHVVKFMNKIQKVNKVILEGIRLGTDEKLTPTFTWNYLEIFACIEKNVRTKSEKLNWAGLLSAAAPGSKIRMADRSLFPDHVSIKFLKMINESITSKFFKSTFPITLQLTTQSFTII